MDNIREKWEEKRPDLVEVIYMALNIPYQNYLLQNNRYRVVS